MSNYLNHLTFAIMIDRFAHKTGACRRHFIAASAVLALAFGTAETRAVDLSSFSENFESLMISSPTALNGWTVYANVYDDFASFLYGYGPYPGPNSGAGFCQVTSGEGGPEQGSQGLVIYSDYNNNNAQESFYLVEANTFQEATVTTTDIGPHLFRFDAKRGNIIIPSTAQAFVKVIDPSNNYALVTSQTLDTSDLPEEWGTYSISFEIESYMVGMLLQFGFSATATNYEASAVHYDNVFFGVEIPAPPVISSITKNGTSVSITFPTVEGASYDLFKSVDGMQSFEQVATQSTIIGDGELQTAEDEDASEPSAFYKIRRMP